MLQLVKNALRLTTNIYDDELVILIGAALADLRLVGIDGEKTCMYTDDRLVQMAVITYCRLHFGSPDDYDRLERAYAEQKGQLITARGYGL